jgi:hypothetical protein
MDRGRTQRTGNPLSVDRPLKQVPASERYRWYVRASPPPGWTKEEERWFRAYWRGLIEEETNVRNVVPSVDADATRRGR